MSPAKRRRWIAWDVYFFDAPFGLELRRRFGPAGVVLFLGFLSACKRSPSQGEITFGSDYEALHTMRLRDLELVDGRGQPFTMTDFWTFLGQHKQTARRRRGELNTVISRNWQKWQTSYMRTGADDEEGTSEATRITHERRRNAVRKKRESPLDLDLGVSPPTPPADQRRLNG